MSHSRSESDPRLVFFPRSRTPGEAARVRVDEAWYRALARRWLLRRGAVRGPRPVAPALRYAHDSGEADVDVGSAFDAR
jgi:hypothetical protein